MEISAAYLDSMIRAIRRNKTEAIIEEVKDLIQEARADLIGVGILEAKVIDESDPLIKGAIRCFVKWKFGLASEDVELYRRDYLDLKENIRRNVNYMEVE